MLTDNTQPAESSRKISVIKTPKTARRLSAAHLSDKVRERIVSLMEFYESSEAAASAACREFPGLKISARLVLEVAVLGIPRKPPVREMSVMGMRRASA